MTEEIRPICLYVETCLDRKEGKRDCAKCEHHLSYWIEVMIRDMEKNIKRLEQENKWQRDEEKYLKECCIKAGKELEKNSFAWDGKEKNLVVQALELNKRYEILEQENKALQAYKDINEDFKQAWYELNEKYKQLRSALEEIRETLKKYDAEAGDTIIANPIQDCYDTYRKINETLNKG